MMNYYFEDDIRTLAIELLRKEPSKYKFMRVSKFINLFFFQYALEYGSSSQFNPTKNDFILGLRASGLASRFKFKGKNPKRVKLIKSKVATNGK